MSEEQIDNNSMKISELPLLSAATNTSWFVIERGTTSYRISYSDLKNYIFNNIDAVMNLGSIVHHDTEEYSKFAHGHDYTDFWFFPSYGPQSNNDEYKSLAKCQHYGTFNIRRFWPGVNKSYLSSIAVCAHEFQDKFENQLSAYNPRKVGDLQFLALGQSFETYLTKYRGYTLKSFNNNSLRNVDISKDSFDGYVIPNGTTFSCRASQFKQACLTYAGNENATEFTVPSLDSFFKCNPGIQKTDAMEHFQHQVGIKQHNHSGKIQTDYTINPLYLNLGQAHQFTSSTGNAVKGFVHSGYGSNSTFANLSVVSIEIQAQTEKITVKPIENDDEPYPNYNDIQALVYIGDK